MNILVATGFPPCSAGGGAWIIDQLMRGMNRDRFSWWSSSEQLSPQAQGAVKTFKSAQLPPRLIPHRRFTEIKTLLLRHLWAPHAVRGLRQFIKRQRPDLLWIIPHSWSIPIIHQAVRGAGIPWHISVHDFPYPPTSSLSWQSRFQPMLDDLYSGAVSRDVIGPEMGDELERATGSKADAYFRCSVEPEELDYIRNKPFLFATDKIRIGYPGTILAEDTFARFVEALRLIRPELPQPVEIHLFTGHNYRDRHWFDPTIIVEHGFLYGEELERAYRQCHWGLAIMPLEETNPRYSRYSFPCKFTRSLASGIPIISIGHGESALVRLASRYHLGPVIESGTPQDIAKYLLPALMQVEVTPQLRERLLQCAQMEFNAETNRARLTKLFFHDS
jgi:hypothetical protein